MINISSYNVNGLGIESKRREIFKHIRDCEIDVCLLQETHSTEGTENLWQNEWGGKILFSHGTSAARGVAVMIRPGLAATLELIQRDGNGRYLIVYFEINEEKFSLVSIYAPNEDDPSFFYRTIR